MVSWAAPLPPALAAGGETCAFYPISPPSQPLRPPLLILHANGFSARCYTPLVAHLTRAFTVYGLDMPGQGASPARPVGRAGGPGALAAYGDAAAAAARALAGRHGGARPVCFGHSGGGLAAIAAEQASPGTWAALYLWEPVVLGAGAPADGLAAVARKRRRGWASKTEALASLRTKPPFATFAPACLTAYVDACTVPDGGGGPSSSPPEKIRLACTPEDEAAVFESAGGLARAASDRLASVSCPVMVAAGGADGPASPLAAGAPETAAALPRGRLQTWGGLRHLGPMEAPDAVGRRICAALVAATGRAGGWEGVPAVAAVVAAPEQDGGGGPRGASPPAARL